MSHSPKVLVIGALGQVGTELTLSLEAQHGADNVIASDIGTRHTPFKAHFTHLDCTDSNALFQLVKSEQINVIYHLAALLSATAEAKPALAWHLNIEGLRNVLNVAQQLHCQVFVPSSIAAFGESTPKDHTPQLTIQRPSTLYGITKVTGELLCDYYVQRYDMDIRGLRYPGLISTKAPPGGGTTDYTVAMLQAAAQGKDYICPLPANAALDMMYMPDAIKATLELMQADTDQLRHRNAYNVTAFSITPQDLATAIQRHVPNFHVSYAPDARLRAIADSWPNSLDDSAARSDWGWQPDYDLDAMIIDTLEIFRNDLQ